MLSSNLTMKRFGLSSLKYDSYAQGRIGGGTPSISGIRPPADPKGPP